MRAIGLALLLFSSAALATLPGYKLSLGAEVEGGTLRVEPTITAPPGADLRYEMITTRSGGSGNSNSRQSGNVTVDADGKAALSQVAMSVGAQDRYEVRVNVYDGGKLVASETLRHPK